MDNGGFSDEREREANPLWKERGEGAGEARSYLGDARVGALDVPAGPVEPGLGGGRAAVRPQRAFGLAAAPAAFELGVGFQAEPAALALGCALVEVHCREEGTGQSGRSQELKYSYRLRLLLDLHRLSFDLTSRGAGLPLWFPKPRLYRRCSVSTPVSGAERVAFVQSGIHRDHNVSACSHGDSS